MAAWMEDITTDEISYGADISVNVYQPDDWETTVTSWFKVLKPTQICFTKKKYCNYFLGSTLGSSSSGQLD